MMALPDPDDPSPPIQRLAGDALHAVAGFVRGTLGCGCPDEVLRSIEVVRPDAGELPTVRLRVGGRLLIHLVEATRALSSPGRLESLAAEGRAERDAGGYNRFRLVLVAEEEPAATTAAAEDRFLAGTAGDERSHLHWAAQRDVPEVIRPD
jgi:hypothetical protein